MIEEATAAEEAHGELALARIALSEDDLRHAANHLAAALTHEPRLPETHELLAVLAARCADGGLGLFPLDGQAYLGTVVAHAHLLARTDPGAALLLLAQASAHDPGRPWAEVSWVRAVDPGTVDPDTLVQVFVTLMRSLGDPAPDDVREANDAYLDLARRAVQAHPEHAFVLATAAGIGRRVGATALAVRWGRRAVELDRSKLTSVWYAYALRADGQLAEGLRVLGEARRENPLDLDLCADMAEWLSQDGRLDEAIELIDEAIRIDPSYDCAVHTACRLRYTRDGNPAHLIALADFIRDHPVASHEHEDLQHCCHGRHWLGQVTPSTEACVNLLGEVPPEVRAGAGRVTLSALEVPSALALLRREWPGLEVQVEEAPAADLVTPLRPGRALWRYQENRARPATGPASARGAGLLRDVAAPFWPHPVAAFDRALPLGQLPVDDLLALLVQPPERPARLASLPDGWWERSAQVFACLGILHCEQLGRDGPTAAHRALLAEIAFGLEDWTTEAALFALTVAAWVDPSCRAEVAETVGRRFMAAVTASRQRAVTILQSLATLVPIVPGMDPEVVALARYVVEQLARQTD